MGKPTEAGAEATLESSIPPPPYAPSDAATASSSSAAQLGFSPASESANVSTSSSLSLHHPIPHSLSAYMQLKLTRTIHVGDSTNHKLYALSSHFIAAGGTYDGKPCLVLHNGPDDKDAALATISEEPSWTLASTASIITLPPLNSPAGAAATPQGISNGVTEIMRPGIFDNEVTFGFRFSVEVEHGGLLRREDFEWQKADKDQMADAKAVYKLVRLKSRTNQVGEAESSRDTPDVVAIAGFKGSLSWKKPFRFEFLGDGATGGLGDRWSVMALVTAIRLWLLHLQGRIR
ncbi:hypothetical protein CH063_05408 [Colletotrichum higginsianum]|uniref:Uncharacterized protein n=2 Tax=Colletotrichum higginsianum TaxID=80884 RepID=H1UYW0_COLHI|nr:hypothetical protein CH63R_08628 [Colletotrichum higginsianum IMI 349063]OBR07107.1 hypothetical protein CH63R_08628 [Colletotrichum higginsianum IMI 349063]TIC92620.1 hypothetical protein CH35J_010110 [Colletotrichum higginsianum]GJC98768.1 hypothetical protein ColKHC_07594 [Colletotrichum higginsianum]CCF33161.1 hypothetical protein CH063_05408 [Colletotrichum higginsianum]